MRLPPAPLEQWLRDYYFEAKVDISSSGVEPYGFHEIRELLKIDAADLDEITFRDSRSCGDPRLREAISRRWGNGDPNRVMATNGSSEALFLVLSTLLSPGDEVVAIDPAYHSLVSIASGIGCRIISWRLGADNGFQPDLDTLAQLLTSRTRMLIVNFPHNPTGVSLTPGAQEQLIAMAEEVGCYLIWDAAFADLTYDSAPLPDPSLRYERAITFGTLSKAFGLPGLRVGWCIAPADVLEACVQWRDYTTLALSPLVELLAIRAVEKADELLRPRLAIARHNLEFLENWIAEQADRVEWVRPHGGVVAFPRFPYVEDVVAFCHQLMQEYRVLLVPGTCFGLSGHVRLGFGCPTAELEQGLTAVSALLKTCSP